MKSRSQISRGNAKDHWVLVRKIAKLTGVPVADIRKAWLPRLKAHLGQRPLGTRVTPRRVESLKRLILGEAQPQITKTAGPAKKLLVGPSTVEPTKARSLTVAPDVSPALPKPKVTIIQATIEGDVSVAASLLLSLPSVKEVWVRKD